MDMRPFVKMAITPFVAVFCLTTLPQVSAVERDLEPVVVKGETFTEFQGAGIAEANNELFLYAYHQDENRWEQIPFQFDEIGSVGDTVFSYFIPDDGLLDANDELVFMAKDAGDRAPDQWISDIGSQNSLRYEIAMNDPLTQDQPAWVYLYRSATLTIDQNAADYIDHTPSATANIGEDTVTSEFYTMAHGLNGFPADLSISAAGGGNGQDLMDAFKLRATILFFGQPLFNITEEFIVLEPDSGDVVNVIDGRVRVIRQLDASFNIGALLDFPTPPFFYYPYSHGFDILIPDVSALAQGATLGDGRLSIDLTSSASGMTFVSAKNGEPGFTVDGSPDSPDKAIDDILPAGNWAYLNGSQGTVIHIFPLETSVGGAREMYYKDDSAIDNNDTGDMMSYGDIGISVTGGITPPVVFSYIGFFLGNDQTSDMGQKIADNAATPLDVSGSPETFGEVTSVDLIDNGLIPESFALQQNFPNPFNPETQIRYDLAAADQVTLTIYNLLGQKVRTLVDENQIAGSYVARWDGKDELGRDVTTGVYVYRLSTGNLISSKKMILIK